MSRTGKSESDFVPVTVAAGETESILKVAS